MSAADRALLIHGIDQVFIFFIDEFPFQLQGRGDFLIFNGKGSEQQFEFFNDLFCPAGHGRLVSSGRKWCLSFGQLNPFAHLAERIDRRLDKETLQATA
jgi:hypothetical protein